MPPSHPNAACVVRITIGLTIGAAMRKVIASAGARPRIMSPRAKGTLPHSQTGISIPNSDSTARRAHARFGNQRWMTSAGSHTCTTIDSSTPRITNGRASISTLSARVSPSCARVGSDAGNS